MAMSEGERISRLLAPGGRYLSNKQTRDAGEITLMRQARANPPRTKTVFSGNFLVFGYTGADQTFIVPTGITEIETIMWGAGGGSHSISSNAYGGAGASIQGKLRVTAGETLTVIVGQGGTNAQISTGTRYGGGGAPGGNGGGSPANLSASGGGRSAIRRGAVDIATAGAGGGGRTAGVGGRGGIIEGTNGGVSAGLKGTQTAGGNVGGALYTGGNGIQDNSAGGGGGYYGGGGGSQDVAGGGGSSLFSNFVGSYSGFESVNGFSAPNTTSPYYVTGTAEGGTPVNRTGGNGLVVILWNVAQTVSEEKFNTFEAQLLRKQYCVICSMPDYSANGQIATDLSGGPIKGAYVAPWTPLPNKARLTSAEQCSACQEFYFPGGAPCCASNPKYTTNYIDTFDDKYGENRTGKRR